MRTESPARLALTSRDKATIFTPSDSMHLRISICSISETELAAPTPDIENVVHELLIVSGANVHASEKRFGMVGLHAIQLGFQKNMFIVNWNATKLSERPVDYEPRFRIFANATLHDLSDETNEDREGCFSLQAGIGGVVTRHNQLTLRGVEVDIDKFRRTGEVSFLPVNEPVTDSYTARIIQHESDHGLGKRCFAGASELYEITDRKRFLHTQGREGKRIIGGDEAAVLRKLSQPSQD